MDENSKLEEENAELKKVKQVKIEVTRDYKKLAKDLQEQGEQLTKAIKIIRKLYSHVFQGMGFMEINDYNVQKAEAEQFLSEKGK